MWNLITLVADSLVIFAAIGVGMRWHATILKHRKPKPPPAPNLTCGCQHVLAFHDPATGVCQQKMWNTRYEAKRTKDGRVAGSTPISELVECPCRQYTGELTADWYARSMLRPDATQQKELDT